MSDISITAANVVRVGGSVNKNYNAGETTTAGQSVYLKTTDSKWYKAQADGTAEEAGGGTIVGVALHAASAGQPLAVQTDGTITIGGTVVAGTVYVVATTAGGIAPIADLASTNRVTIIGYGTSTSVIAINPIITGVTIA